MKSNNKEFRNKEFDYFYKRVGKTIQRKYMVGITFTYIMFNLFFIFFTFVFKDSNYVITYKIQILITILSFVGLLICLVRAHRALYYRHMLLTQILSTTILTTQFFIVGFWFILISNQSSLQTWVLGGWGIGLTFALHRIKQEPYKWDRARKHGKLIGYLDENAWTFKFDIPNTIESKLISADESKNRWYLFNRLEKLHYLMPAIGMMLSRNFPDQRQILLGIVSLSLGLIFFAHLHFPLYMQIRRWEKERGKPLTLHESWDK